MLYLLKTAKYGHIEHLHGNLVDWEMADSELAAKLNRQQQRADGEIAPAKVSQSVYAEFKEFSIPEIKEYRKVFQK